MNEKPDAENDAEEKPGLLMRVHRDTVESSTGMSSAVLLGSSFALAMGLFAWLGHQWDERRGTAPWGVLAGVGLGLAYGAYEVWKLIRMAEIAAGRERREGRDQPDSESP